MSRSYNTVYLIPFDYADKTIVKNQLQRRSAMASAYTLVSTFYNSLEHYRGGDNKTFNRKYMSVFCGFLLYNYDTQD